MSDAPSRVRGVRGVRGVRTFARVAALVALAALLLAQSGCIVLAGVGATGALVGGAAGALAAGNRPAPVTALGAAVTIALDPPRDLAAVSGATGDTTWLRNVRSAIGRVTAERGDTIWVALTEVQGAHGPATFPAIAGPVAEVLRGSGVRMTIVTARADRATTIYVGAALGAALAVLGVYFWCSQTACLD